MFGLSVLLDNRVLIPAFLLIWSSVFAVARLGLAHAAPMTLLSIRFAIAALIAAGIGFLLRQPLPKVRVLAALMLVGIVNHAVYLGLSYMGMRHVSAGLTSIIVSVNPVLTAVMAALVLEERLNLRKLMGLGLGVVGVLFILRHRTGIGADQLEDLLWPVGALAALSGGAILFKRFGGSGAGFTGLAVQLAAAAIASAAPAWAFESDLPFEPSGELWFSLAYQAVLASVVAYAVWFHLLRTAGAVQASAWHFLIPPLGVLFGVLIMDEHVLWADLIGILPVVAGIWLVNRSGISLRFQRRR